MKYHVLHMPNIITERAHRVVIGCFVSCLARLCCVLLYYSLRKQQPADNNDFNSLQFVYLSVHIILPTDISLNVSTISYNRQCGCFRCCAQSHPTIHTTDQWLANALHRFEGANYLTLLPQKRRAL